MFLPQRTGQRHLFRSARRREARSDGVERAALAMPALDERLRVVVAALRGIAQGFGRVSIHEAFAGDATHAAFRDGLEERIHGLGMHGAERRHGRGAVAQAFIEKRAGDAARMRRVRELLFGDEGVFFQPVEQLLAVGAHDLQLRVMNMAIDEARQNQMILVVFFDRRAGGSWGAISTAGPKCVITPSAKAISASLSNRQAAGPSTKGSAAKVSAGPRSA